MNTPSNRTEMTITIERTPRTFTVDGNDIQVEELGISLPFARKPVDLRDMSASGDYLVYVTETRTMTPEEFDGFGATARTLRVFCEHYYELLGIVRDAMVPNPDKKK